MKFSVHRRAELAVEPDLKSFSELCARELFPADASAPSTALSVRCLGLRPEEHVLEETIGDLAGAYCGEVVLRSGVHFCRLNEAVLKLATGGRDEFRETLLVCCPNFKASVLLEWIVLPVLLGALGCYGFAPVHASGFRSARTGREIIFAAWAGVGKTSLLLAAKRLGVIADYLGDDLVLIGRDGTVAPSSRTVSLYGYNLPLAQDMVSVRTRVRMRVGEAIRSVGTGRRLARPGLTPFMQKAGNTLANARVPMSLGDVNTSPAGSARPKPIVATCLTSPRVERFELSPDFREPESVVAAFMSVIDYEFVRFRAYLSAWGWASDTPADPWRAIRVRWEANVSEWLSSSGGSLYRLAIPPRVPTLSEYAHVLTEVESCQG